MKRLLAVLAALFVAACQHSPEPVIRTVEVLKPVAVPCDAKPPARPAFPDTDAALTRAEADEMLALLYAGRKMRDPYIAALETAIEACAKGWDG